LAAVDRILVDLGLSSDQLADRNRGFGFQTEGDLDMRFDRSAGRTAGELLNELARDELKRVFEEYGEEPFAEAVAEEIVRRRGETKIETVTDLVAAVEAAIPRKIRTRSKKHPATRVFQALRIAVNEELEHLQRSLAETFPRCLKPGGLLAVITFHSLEDRIVKHAFQDQSTWESRPPKPVLPRPNEQKINPRSRSAKLRTARRV
jgi:16S rRNA (cytosine1402-N4)-methyltransferase